MKVYEGKPKLSREGIAIVVSRFNEPITRRLLDACVDELIKLGLKKSSLHVAWVPGAHEIPVTALTFAKKKNIHAVICLGAVILGETFHYELVARGAAEGIKDVALQTGKPVIFEVLACDTMKKATDRAKVKGVNKGREAALTAAEMIDVLRKIK